MLNKVSDRVYFMDYVQDGDRPVLGLICGDKYSLVVDGGNSKAHANKFLDYVSRLDIKPIKYLVLTHWHWDHVFGINTMNAINIVHKDSVDKLKWMKTLKWTDEALRERVLKNEEIEFCEKHLKIEYPNNNRDCDIEIPTCDIIFDNFIEIDLGGITVKAHHIKSDHSHDNVLVVCDDVVFMGDCMYLDMFSGEYSYSRDLLYPLLDKLLSFDANYYIPSHHPKYTNKEFSDFVGYIKEIGNTVDDSINIQDSINKFKLLKNREITHEEIDDIKTFIEGNKKRTT